MIRLRENGVAISKEAMAKQGKGLYGILSMGESGESATYKSRRLATFEHGGSLEWQVTLYDPQLISIREGKLMLKGYERVKTDSLEIAEHAQSWICDLYPSQDYELPK